MGVRMCILGSFTHQAATLQQLKVDKTPVHRIQYCGCTKPAIRALELMQEQSFFGWLSGYVLILFDHNIGSRS